jgi:alpha-beta hydrolase superfamily lysophospholipase
MDHGGNFMEPGLYFRKRGIAVVAHDQQGHYRQGKVYIKRFDVFLDDLDLMVNWAKEQYPGLPVFMVGHSMGGLIATHYGLTRLNKDPRIRGYILSSPYYVNAVKTPKIVEKMAGILAALAPRMTVPLEDIRGYVTHDEGIFQRQEKDIRDNIMANKSSLRFGNELLKAQRWVPEHLAGWKHPLLAIVAGDDKVADAVAARDLLGHVAPDLLTELYYPGNYHENFNELNRVEIFQEIQKWVEARI